MTKAACRPPYVNYLSDRLGCTNPDWGPAHSWVVSSAASLLPVGQAAGVGGAPAASSCFSSALISVSTSLRSFGNLGRQPVGRDLILLHRGLGRPSRSPARGRCGVLRMSGDGFRALLRCARARRGRRSAPGRFRPSVRSSFSVSSRSLTGRLGVASIARRMASSRVPASVGSLGGGGQRLLEPGELVLELGHRRRGLPCVAGPSAATSNGLRSGERCDHAVHAAWRA